ncbi:MAG: hypothetical protein V5B30_20085 [Candidatus Accumulibacter delftensis]
MTFPYTFWPILAATLAVIVLAGLGLSLGMFFGRPPPRGSCGGLASGACACATGKKPARCQPLSSESAPSATVRYPSPGT